MQLSVHIWKSKRRVEMGGQETFKLFSVPPSFFSFCPTVVQNVPNRWWLSFCSSVHLPCSAIRAAVGELGCRQGGLGAAASQRISEPLGSLHAALWGLVRATKTHTHGSRAKRERKGDGSLPRLRDRMGCLEGGRGVLEWGSCVWVWGWLCTPMCVRMLSNLKLGQFIYTTQVGCLQKTTRCVI